MDLCDGSMGSHWSQFRSTDCWADTVGSYFHLFRDKRGLRECKAYKMSELPYFRRWIRENYRPNHLPKYLVDKYGKRAVRQVYTEINGLTNYIIEITEEKRPSLKQEDLYEQFLSARAMLVKV